MSDGGTVIAFARRARTVLAVQYAQMVAFRAELILWALSNSLSFILMGVWYQATSRADFGLAPIDVIRYFLIVFVIRQLTVVWVIWDFEVDVQRGRLAHHLLAPLDPFWRHLSGHVAERLARLPFSIGLIVLFFVIYPGAFFIPHSIQALWFAVLVVGAFLLRFVLQYTLALMSFWTERASALETLMFTFYMFLGGAVAPLDVFPAALREVVLYTPFPYLVWMPARALTGGIADAELWRGGLVMSVWFIGVVVVSRVIWRLGLRRFSAMGA